MMKILHVLEDYSHSSGGIRTVVNDLNRELVRAGHKSSIISCFKTEEDNSSYLIESSKPWLYSKKWEVVFKKILNTDGIDLIHIHGVWMYPQLIASKFAIKNKIPFILSPHGMYEPWLWTKGTIKKKLYFNLISKKVFKNATCLHAITIDEVKNLQKLFPNANINEIPNLINNVKYDKKIINEKYLLYVGRIDEKKGIDILLKAFSNFNESPYKIKLVGEINDYQKRLVELCESLKIENKVEFLGRITGDSKNDLFANAFYFIAPSHSEVIGMVNLEAAILGTPVVTTYQTGLKQEWNENGGILINPEVDELIEALRKIFNLSVAERNIFGEKLQNYVIKNYSWDTRFKDWLSLYKNSIKTNKYV